MTKITREDYKFVPADPEPGFSPEHNKRVIESTIKKYEAMRAKKEKEFKDGLSERADALATYFLSDKSLSKPAHKYFGKRWTAYLRGDFLRRKLMGNSIQMNTNKLYSNIKNADMQKQSK